MVAYAMVTGTWLTHLSFMFPPHPPLKILVPPLLGGSQEWTSPPSYPGQRSPQPIYDSIRVSPSRLDGRSIRLSFTPPCGYRQLPRHGGNSSLPHSFPIIHRQCRHYLLPKTSGDQRPPSTAQDTIRQRTINHDRRNPADKTKTNQLRPRGAGRPHARHTAQFQTTSDTWNVSSGRWEESIAAAVALLVISIQSGTSAAPTFIIPSFGP